MKYVNSSNKLEYANNQKQKLNITCKLKYKQKITENKWENVFYNCFHIVFINKYTVCIF